jgi:hypothetical protein
MRQVRRSHWRLKASLIAAAGLLVAGIAQPAVAQTGSPPVIAADAPDPAVVFDQADGFYYSFTTQASGPGGFAQVPEWRSPDLVSWSYLGDALARLPVWAASDAFTSAPSVALIAGEWVLYYAVFAANGEMCVSRAVTGALSSPFQDGSAEPMICGIGDGNSAIDPSVFVDRNGAPSLLWKNEGSQQIFSEPLSADGLRLVGSPVNVYNPDQPWIGLGVENPNMTVINGIYYLFFSYDYWSSPSYSTGYAVCDGPYGPCHGVGTVLQSTEFAIGPGGMCIFRSKSGELLVAYHGWVDVVGYDQGGMRELFIGALSVGGDGPVIAPSDPFGSIDVVKTTAQGNALLYGWAVNLDVDGPVMVHVYVDGRLVDGVAADQSRTDVARAFGVSNNHGFTIETKPGHVCLYLIDEPPGTNPLLGCRDVGTQPPIGSFDLAAADQQGVRLAGWAFDPDTPASALAVHIYVDGLLLTGATADRERTDVGATFPAAGANHGFDATIAISSGPHQVCVYGINTGPGANPLLGCKTVAA